MRVSRGLQRVREWCKCKLSDALVGSTNSLISYASVGLSAQVFHEVGQEIRCRGCSDSSSRL